MIGSTVAHYKILEKLGEGGMGVVYKAEDTLLDRVVALKFLPFHLATSDPERLRFIQEAKAAAALNHPNICTIYGIEEADDKSFIAMEYVDGGTLRDSIVNGQLSIANSIGYAIQIGEALQEAHSLVTVGSLLVLLAATTIFIFPWGPEINPDKIAVTYPIPFHDVKYASMSRHGNWVVFPAADDRGKFDVYRLHLSQGQQPVRVTNDSSYLIITACISPDDGTILYARREIGMSLFQVVSVPSGGGLGRVVIDSVAHLASWLPDGSRICYATVSPLEQNRSRYVVWTARPEGVSYPSRYVGETQVDWIWLER